VPSNELFLSTKQAGVESWAEQLYSSTLISEDQDKPLSYFKQKIDWDYQDPKGALLT
jgi:hypothetical protein